MKKHMFWKILLGVVVAVVVLGAIGFGVFRMRMWGGRFGAVGMMHQDYGQMPDGYGTDMPCEEEGEAVCAEIMPYGRFPMRGMGGMPYYRGMHGGWGRHGSSLLTNLLLLALVVVGVLHLGRWRRFHKLYHHGPMHMHPGHHSANDACCCSAEPGNSGVAPDSGENQPDSE
jgi:hypothetical protein